MREGIYVFVRGAVRTRGELFVARCACVYLFFGVQRGGGGKDVCWRQRWWGFMNWVGRVGEREENKNIKKGNGLLDLGFGGGNTVARSAGNDDGRVVDVNDLDLTQPVAGGGVVGDDKKGR